MPKVSVIIPVYNAELYLERCLDSVCSQTLKDIEIICVDDCSKDGSLAILNKYAQADSRIKVIDCKVNGGESKARNIGLDVASGEYLAFVDNDDEIDLDFYEKLYEAARKNDADIAKGEVRIIDYNGKDRFDCLNDKIRTNCSLLFFAYYWWTAIYKRQLIKQNNIRFLEGYPLGGDVLFLNQAVLAAGAYALCDEAIYHYYRREDSGDSKVLSLEKIKSVIMIHEKIIDNVIAYAETADNKSGVIFVLMWCMTSFFNYAFRRRTLETLDYVVDRMFGIYEKIADKLAFCDEVDEQYECDFDYVKRGDKQGLKDFYFQNDNFQKIFMARTRYKINKARTTCKSGAEI